MALESNKQQSETSVLKLTYLGSNQKLRFAERVNTDTSKINVDAYGWVKLTTTGSITARYFHTTVFNSKVNVAYTYGGFKSGLVYSDIYTFPIDPANTAKCKHFL